MKNKNLFKGLFAKDNSEGLVEILKKVNEYIKQIKALRDAQDDDGARATLKAAIQEFNKPVILALLGASEKEDLSIKFNKKPVDAQTLTVIIEISNALYSNFILLYDENNRPKQVNVNINEKKVKAAKGDVRKAIDAIGSTVMSPTTIAQLNQCGVDIHKGITKKRRIIIGGIILVIGTAGVGYVIFNKKHNESSEDDVDVADEIEVDEDTEVDIDVAESEAEIGAGLAAMM